MKHLKEKIVRLFYLSILGVLLILLIDLAAFILLPYSLLYATCVQVPLEKHSSVAVLFHDFDTTVSGIDRETERRLNFAIELFHKTESKYLIVAGGNREGREVKGAQLMKKYAVRERVPPHKILVEDTSYDTQSNLAAIGKLIEKHKINSFILVSSPYHVKRIELLVSPGKSLPPMASYDPGNVFPHVTRMEALKSAHHNLAALAAKTILSEKNYTAAVLWIRENTDF